MNFVTREGHALQLERVDRRLLDALVLPAPQPPTRQVETWGGLLEAAPIHDDPDYQAQLFQHKLKLYNAQLNILAGGVTLPPVLQQQFAALQAVIPARGLPAAVVALRYILNVPDRTAVVEELLYLSTVTIRGIQEAQARLNYSWRGKPLRMWGVGASPGRRGQLAIDFTAAVRSGLTWSQFCQLPGAEQSLHVAYWDAENRLNYLLQQQQSKRK